MLSAIYAGTTGLLALTRKSTNSYIGFGLACVPCLIGFCRYFYTNRKFNEIMREGYGAIKNAREFHEGALALGCSGMLLKNEMDKLSTMEMICYSTITLVCWAGSVYYSFIM
jgi:hypothetical protein